MTHCKECKLDSQGAKGYRCDLCNKTFCMACIGSKLTATELRALDLVKRCLTFHCEECKVFIRDSYAGVSISDTDTHPVAGDRLDEFAADLRGIFRDEIKGLYSGISEMQVLIKNEKNDLANMLTNFIAYKMFPESSSADLEAGKVCGVGSASFCSVAPGNLDDSGAAVLEKNLPLAGRSVAFSEVSRQNSLGLKKDVNLGNNRTKVDKSLSKVRPVADHEVTAVNMKTGGEPQETFDDQEGFILVSGRRRRAKKPGLAKPVSERRGSSDGRVMGETAGSRMGLIKKHGDGGLVGTGQSVPGVKAVPKKSFIYVSRFAPETTVDSVKGVVSSLCQEVECEQLRSKYPQFYSSFKITVNAANKDKVMDPGIWPAGIYINRFFRAGRQSDSDGTVGGIK